MAGYHDRKIDDVCKRSQPGVLPYLSYAPKGWGGFPGGKLALTEPGPAPAVSEINVNRLMSALASLNSAGPAAVKKAGSLTIGEFRAKSAVDQVKWIDELWDLIATPHAFDTKAQDMYVPGPVPRGNAPLPSSWCPIPGNRSNYRMRMTGGGRRDPWTELCVGFRVDGRDMKSLDRVRSNGMTQQILNPAFMRDIRGLVVEGTTAGDTSKPRFWSGNDDIFNETAVCVSRNFFGGTAFPERGTYHTQEQFAILWAVDCSGLMGLDTEAVQLRLKGSRHWRPGEKAFREIKPNRLIGYVTIRKMGTTDAGGWTFDIPPGSAWTYTGAGTSDQKTYIGGELEAWTGCHHIRGEFDFAK